VIAIRVAKRSRGRVSGYKWHWLLDPGRTFCGRDPADLDVVEQEERESLPQIEACRGCVRTVEGWSPPRHASDTRVLASPRPGRLRTTGSLSHGFRGRGGRRL
jgi:hypothetical protein